MVSYNRTMTEMFPCIAKAEMDHYVNCSICKKKDFSIGHGGLNDVKRHVLSKSHVNSAVAVSSLFKRCMPTSEYILQSNWRQYYSLWTLPASELDLNLEKVLPKNMDFRTLYFPGNCIIILLKVPVLQTRQYYSKGPLRIHYI